MNPNRIKNMSIKINRFLSSKVGASKIVRKYIKKTSVKVVLKIVKWQEKNPEKSGN